MVKYAQRPIKHVKGSVKPSPAEKMLHEAFGTTRRPLANSTRAHGGPSSHSKALLTGPTNAQQQRKATHESEDEFAQDDDGDAALSSDEEEDWDDGRILIDAIDNRDIEVRDTDLEDQMAIVDGIQVPINEKSKERQKEHASTLVSAMSHIRLVHNLQGPVGEKLETALLKTDASATAYQMVGANNKNDMQEMVKASNETLRDLFNILKREYEHRNQLFLDLQAKVCQIAAPARQSFQDVARVSLDDLEMKLQKKAVVLAKPDKTSKSQELLLKGLMSKK